MSSWGRGELSTRDKATDYMDWKGGRGDGRDSEARSGGTMKQDSRGSRTIRRQIISLGDPENIINGRNSRQCIVLLQYGPREESLTMAI